MEQYRIIYGQSTNDLENEVNAYIQQGWLVTGGLFVLYSSLSGEDGFYQAIIKPKS